MPVNAASPRIARSQALCRRVFCGDLLNAPSTMRAAAWTKLTLWVLLNFAPMARAFVVISNKSGVGRRWRLLAPDNTASTNLINRTTRAIRYMLAADACSPTNAAAELNATASAYFTPLPPKMSRAEPMVRSILPRPNRVTASRSVIEFAPPA